MAIPSNVFNWQQLNNNGFMFCSISWVKAEIYQSYANDNTWAVVISHGGFKGGFKNREAAQVYAERKISDYLEAKYKEYKFNLDLLKKYEHFFSKEG